MIAFVCAIYYMTGLVFLCGYQHEKQALSYDDQEALVKKELGGQPQQVQVFVQQPQMNYSGPLIQ